MIFFKTYIKEHFFVFLISLSLWLCGVFLGIYASFNMASDITKHIGEYILTATEGNRGYFDTLKNGVWANLKYMSLISLSSLFLPFLPLTAFLIGFKGFSSGFVSSILVRLFAAEGIAVSITGVILPLVFSLPVYFAVFISCLDFPVNNFKMRNQIISAERRSLNVSFLLKMLILFLCLCIITALEAFLSPYFFSVLGKG